MEYACVQMDAVRLELRKTRKARRVTLRRLHEKTGISPSTVNRIERVGKYPKHTPDLETIAALVEAMQMPLWEFFARVEGVALPVATAAAHKEPSRDDPIEAAVTRVAEALVRRIDERTTLVAPAATATPPQAPPVADATPQSGPAREVRAVIEEAKRQRSPASARRRPAKRDRRERDAAKRKRA